MGLCVFALEARPALAQSAGAIHTDDSVVCADMGAVFWARSSLLSQMCGIRTFLGNYGITFNLQEISEVMGNVTGGIKQGATYDGLTTMTVQLDTGKAFGWDGGTFNASALQIHGRSLSANYLDNLQTASGIEADRATRLWEIWYDQQVLDGRADVKLGQQSIDQEFISSSNAALFVNTMLGWPMVPSADLPAGGPAYPLSSLGLRFKGQPTNALTLLAGIFDDNPPGPTSGDGQLQDPSGTNFRTSDGVLLIAEAQYAINQPAVGDMVGSGDSGLPGTYRLGFWYDSGRFPDQAIDGGGLSLANPASSGNPYLHRGNYSLYAVIDQMIWRPDPDSTQSLNFFLRPMGTPDEDRNLIDFSVNAGLTLKAPFAGRDNDTAGIAMGYTHLGSGVRAFDRAVNLFGGPFTPVQTGETFIEVTYQYQIAPWWQLQPDFQYVFNPGGGIINPNDPTGTQKIHNEAILGLRTIITF
jgi:porin